MSKKAIVTVGVSASGKSTWATEFVQEQLLTFGEQYVIVERDKIRAKVLFDRKGISAPAGGVVWDKWNWKWEGDVTNIARSMIAEASENPDVSGVIISDTNLDASRLQSMTTMLTKHGFSVTVKEFPVTWEEAVKRDNARANGVGLSVLAMQFAKVNKLTVKQYAGTPGKPKTVMVDVDGTLAHMVDRGAFEWKKVGQDSVDNEVRDAVIGFANLGYQIVVMSGRDCICRSETETWLHNNHIPFNDLFMRKHDDMRNDAIVKSELFWEKVADNFDVKLVIDDRPKVLRMWRAMGVKTMQMGDPYSEF